MRQEMTGFWDAVAPAGPYENNLHLDADRYPHQHLITQFLQAGCSSWCPTNSFKALKAMPEHYKYKIFVKWGNKSVSKDDSGWPFSWWPASRHWETWDSALPRSQCCQKPLLHHLQGTETKHSHARTAQSQWHFVWSYSKLSSLHSCSKTTWVPTENKHLQ